MIVAALRRGTRATGAAGGGIERIESGLVAIGADIYPPLERSDMPDGEADDPGRDVGGTDVPAGSAWNRLTEGPAGGTDSGEGLAVVELLRPAARTLIAAAAFAVAAAAAATGVVAVVPVWDPGLGGTYGSFLYLLLAAGAATGASAGSLLFWPALAEFPAEQFGRNWAIPGGAVAGLATTVTAHLLAIPFSLRISMVASLNFRSLVTSLASLPLELIAGLIGLAIFGVLTVPFGILVGAALGTAAWYDRS